MGNTVIELSELRIGNLLEYKGDVLYVSMLSLDIDDEYEDQIGITKLGTSSKEMGGWNRSLVNDLKRIPLSPEWLERLGFEKSTSGDEDQRNIWSIQVSNNTSLYYDSDHKYKTWYLSHEWNNNHFQNDFWACPEYIHQLQNLYFALTGEELSIKEKV